MRERGKRKVFFAKSQFAKKRGEEGENTCLPLKSFFYTQGRRRWRGGGDGAEYAIFPVNLFARAKYRPRRENREKENIGREESPGLV